MAPEKSRAAIFAALAQGLDIPRLLQEFQLSEAELRELFRETAAHYRDREEGFWHLYCDGAARGNPGPAGAGIALYGPNGELKAERADYLGETTNNVAEYQALLLGLKVARELGAARLQILADSQLVVEQLNGRYQVKSPHLYPLWRQAREALHHFEAVAIVHVPREENHQADRLARRAIDQKPRSR